MTLWQGRLGDGMADEVAAFTVSLHFDRELAEDDLDGLPGPRRRAWARRGILTDDEVAVLLGALDRVGRSWRRAPSSSSPATRTCTPRSSAG